MRDLFSYYFFIFSNDAADNIWTFFLPAIGLLATYSLDEKLIQDVLGIVGEAPRITYAKREADKQTLPLPHKSNKG